ncbi:DUF1620-domain-containing protein [Lepidopterella palustris CBS 459.81]|uniref:ER membrane protein complex subunit 1 n=1 Tax=Lepidopterella palustris CBS 459.81 TaxID=1314670 RepID=A0A8E2JKD1_9PEZI|nr:DUF1620-domain-containing protein [Lepidopterella palustris CBS 459.81]
MHLHAIISSAACCIAGALAIFADEAYHIDYHRALVGFPTQDATFFHQPYAGSKASLVYTLSNKLILAAVNPKDGATVWRQALSHPPNITEGFLRAGEEQDTVVSAVGGEVTAWSTSDGRFVWKTKFPDTIVKDVEILELEGGRTSREAKDAIILLSGGEHVIKRLDGKTGAVKWTYEDISGDSPFQVSTSATGIHYISLHSTMLGGVKIKVTSLDLVTGQKLDQYTLSSDNEVISPECVLFAGANSASPLLAWTDKAHTVLKVNIIGTKSVSTFNAPRKGAEEVQKIVLHAPRRINSVSHFLVHYQTASTHSAEVYHVDLKKSVISKAYSLPELTGNGAFTTSTTDANVYFTRITAEEMIVVSSASHGILGRWPFKTSISKDQTFPVHGVSEVVVRSDSAQAVRSAVLFSDGQWVLVRNGELVWTRPELLAGALTAVWADLPEQEALAQELAIEGHENILSAYVHRVKRHIRDLEHLPAWLENLPIRILANFGGKTPSTSTTEIQQDSFGFHKLVIIATEANRLVALDAGSAGRLIWNIDLPKLAPGFTFENPTLSASHGYVEVRDSGLESPLLINTTTGGLVSLQDTTTTQNNLQEGQMLVSFDLIDGELKGFLDKKASSPIWSFLPPNGERIVGITARPIEDRVASIGKVLGDRRVLYKYLNPNLVLVTTVLDATRIASVYLLDSASGNLLHAATHSNVDITRQIPSALSENWFSYSFTLDSTTELSSRGYQLVVTELYESAVPNDRGPLGAAANYSSVQPSSALGDAAKPFVISQTYHTAEEISHMTVTQTRQGITSRELLVALPETNSIVGIPRYVIDPRRPIGRDPTALEVGEGLTKYTPVLQFDPKWYLTHKMEVFGVKKIITSPALLESTSLVFAYGLDVFGTRVTPSFAFDVLGKGFNKLQMLATVAALGVSVLFVAPLVRRKQINSLWQIP